MDSFAKADDMFLSVGEEVREAFDIRYIVMAQLVHHESNSYQSHILKFSGILDNCKSALWLRKASFCRHNNIAASVGR